MRTLTKTGTVSPIKRGSHVDETEQLLDQLKSLQSALTEIVTEYNAEVYPVLNSLPRGVEEDRWPADKTIHPKSNGLDGTQFYVTNSATSTLNGGRYWKSTDLRPKTFKEVFDDLFQQITLKTDEVRADISSYSATGVSAAAKARIGANIFDSTLSSSSLSLDGITTSNQMHILQLARDLYDDSYDIWTTSGVGVLTNKSIRDMLEGLLEIHGSDWDSAATATHDVSEGFGTAYSSFTGATNEETTSSTEVVIGGFIFDPSQHGITAAQLTLSFNAIARYVAAGAVGGGYVYLYDLGAPGSTGAGTLCCTLERDYTVGVMDRVRKTITVVAAAPSDNEILNEERVYEIRIKTDGTGDPADIIRVNWAGMIVEPSV